MAGLVPPGLQLPPGVDPTEFYLQLPAMSPHHAPAGANMTMTTDGPDQVWFVVVAITCSAVPALFLSLRIYTRLAIFRSFELADYFLFLAFPLIVAEVPMGYYMVRHGAGVHQWQVTLDQLFHQLYWANIAQVIYCPLCFLVKMAILLQYLKLFAPSRSANKVMFFGSWITIIATLIAYVVFTFWTLFYCTPRRMIWYKLIPGGKCHNVNNIILAQGAFNMASDIIILLLPTASLWQLSVPLTKKIFVTLLFAMGLLACVASAMRIVFTMKIAPAISEADVSHNGLFIGLWTEAEVSLGFIVACVLCLPKLVQVKGKRVRNALSYASSPWSSITSRSRKSASRMSSQKSTQYDSKGSRQLNQMDVGRPMYYEERAEQHRQTLQSDKYRHDIYAIPSTAGNSEYTRSLYSESGCSQDINSNRVSRAEESIPTAMMARSGLPRDISMSTREVPVRLDIADMTMEQLEEERRVLDHIEFDYLTAMIDRKPRRSILY